MLTLAIRNQSGNQGSSLAWTVLCVWPQNAPTALNTLAQLALNWGWIPEAEEVLWHAALKFPKQPLAADLAPDLYMARRDTAGLRRVYQASMQRDPKDKSARNDYASLSLLCGKDLPTAHRYAAELYTVNLAIRFSPPPMLSPFTSRARQTGDRGLAGV